MPQIALLKMLQPPPLMPYMKRKKVRADTLMVHDVVASESLSSTYRCDHATVFPVGVTAGVTDYADNVWI